MKTQKRYTICPVCIKEITGNLDTHILSEHYEEVIVLIRGRYNKIVKRVEPSKFNTIVDNKLRNCMDRKLTWELKR